MTKPDYTFLLIDDQKAKMSAFITAAQQRRILIHAVDNVEDGIAKLKADPERYEAVILDAKCKLRKADQAESYNEAALHTAIRELDAMAKASSRALPRCIYTGYSEAADNHGLTEKVFMKGGRGTEGALFDFLCGEVNLIPTRTIERDYAASLALCDDHYLPRAKRDAMLALLLRMNSTDATEIEQFIQSARKFLEDLYKRMNQLDNTWLPDVLTPKGKPTLTWCSIYMAGQDVKQNGSIVCPGLAGVPKHISHSIRFLTDSSHTTSHTATYQPGQYALRSLVFALLEVLNWFKIEVDSHTSSHP